MLFINAKQVKIKQFVILSIFLLLFDDSMYIIYDSTYLMFECRDEDGWKFLQKKNYYYTL